MSSTSNVQSTLEALAQHIHDHFVSQSRGITVYTELPGIPFTGRLPCIVLSEYRQIVARLFTSVRGNPDKLPNLYSFVILHAPITQQQRSQAGTTSGPRPLPGNGGNGGNGENGEKSGNGGNGGNGGAHGDGLRLPTAIRELRKDIDCLIEAFSFTLDKEGGLGQHVITAGESIEMHYDRLGPYVTYFGTSYIGAFGLIDVAELYRFDA